jgi:hypothetical protein
VIAKKRAASYGGVTDARSEVATPVSDVNRASSDLMMFVPAWIDDLGLSSAEFRVYARVARCSYKNPDGCFQSLDTIARRCHMNKKTVRKALRSLVHKRLIRKEGKPGHTDAYHLANPNEVPKEAMGEVPKEAMGEVPKEATPPQYQTRPPMVPSPDGTLFYGTNKGGRCSRRRGSVVKLDGFVLGAELNTPQFKQAWSEWLDHRQQLWPRLTPESVKEQLQQCVDWGHETALVALDYSVMQGCKNLYLPRDYKPNSKPSTAKESGRLVW